MNYSIQSKKQSRANLAETKRTVIGTDSRDKSAPKQLATTKRGKLYTEAEINEMTSSAGYFIVHPEMWDHIATGSHIRYMKKDKGDGKSSGERFKPGGFVRNHFETDLGKKMLMIENKPHGNKDMPGYITFPIAYEDVEILWKKYDRGSFIEIHLIHQSLLQKKEQIRDLTARVEALEKRLGKTSY